MLSVGKQYAGLHLNRNIKIQPGVHQHVNGTRVRLNNLAPGPLRSAELIPIIATLNISVSNKN